jgi:predicted P-loop ATPase
MNEELLQLDADLKGLFVENKVDEMIELLKEQPNTTIKEISDFSWSVIKKYYDAERFDLLFNHITFVAYTCFIIEYTHQIGLITNEDFDAMMMVYSDIYEMKKQQK